MNVFFIYSIGDLIMGTWGYTILTVTGTLGLIVAFGCFIF